jgi:predicted nuclease of predicted toxin-antitoxin system
MRLLADENFPRAAVDGLRAAGHEVAWIRTEAPGATDEQVLARARDEGRGLVTLDKDFGVLVLRRGLGASQGVVLLRIPFASPDEFAARAVAALVARGDWAGHFSVIEDDRVRMRPLVAVRPVE